LQPSLQLVDQRTRARLSLESTFIGQSPADLALDVVEIADSSYRLVSDRRAGGFVQVVELAPGVCPARGFQDPAFLVELIEACVAIGLQDAGKVL